MSKIRCVGMQKAYGQVAVVHDFDLSINDHELVVFLGPSGCGKSTILRMIAGLEEISGGELYIGEMLANDVEPRERGVAMVFQNYALYPHMSIFDNIAFGLKRLRVPAAEIAQRVKAVASTLGLEPYLDRRPTQLSGGQQQRVAIARAMIKTPKVFLFDEPLSNLDAQLRHHMRGEIAKLHQQLKTTTVYVTHDQLEAMALADRIVLLRAGRIEQVGTPREIYGAPTTRFAAEFIGTPKMNFLDVTIAAEKGRPVAKADEFRLELPQARFDIADRTSAVLGVRPPDLAVVANTDPSASVRGTVRLFEYLGNDVLIFIATKAAEISVLAPASTQVEVGDTVALKMKPEAIHLFDSASGKSLLSKGPAGRA